MLKPIITSCAIVLLCAATNAQEVLRVQNAATLTVQSNVELTIDGDVVLTNGSTLTNNGTIRTRRNGSGTGNWTDNTITPYNHGTGRFIFNSTAVQTISSNNIFERIEMNGAGLSLATNISANKWYLIAGAITTGSSRAIALSNAQLAIEADGLNPNFTNSWFNGNLRRYVNPAVVNNYLFPIGNASRVNLAEMDDLTATPLAGIAYIDALFGSKPGSDAGLAVSENGTSYVSVNSGGVWYLTPDASPSLGRYDLKLFFNGFTGLLNNRFAILLRPQASSNAADWAVPPGSVLPPNGNAGRMVADGYARRNDLGALGQLGIGELFAALPVTLANFDAVRLTKLKVKLDWQTSTEINNKGFEIERRLENEASFTTLGFIASKAADGNSTLKLDYTLVDPNGYGGVSYYRLKQLDKDGRAFHSLIKAVKGLGETSVSILLWPNPARGQFSIRLDGATGIKDAFITDASGTTLRRMRLGNSQQINIQGLPAGTYVITVLNAFGDGDDFREKVIVIK